MTRIEASTSLPVTARQHWRGPISTAWRRPSSATHFTISRGPQSQRVVLAYRPKPTLEAAFPIAGAQAYLTVRSNYWRRDPRAVLVEAGQ